MVLIIYQYIVYFTNGKITSFLIPDLKLNYGARAKGIVLINQMKQSAYFRPCSIFIEPAFQAAYIIPWIPMALIKNINKPNIKSLLSVIIVSVMLCMGASFTALACCAIIWFGYLLISIKYSKISYKTTYLFFFLLIVGIFAIYKILSLESVQNQISGKIESLNHLNKSSSLTLRLLRGALCFYEMDFFHQLFGCGYNGFYYYYKQAHISTIYDYNVGANITYMSGWFYALCNLGIVGFLIYLSIILPKVFRKYNLAGLFAFIAFSAMMLGTSMFETPVYYLSLYLIATSPEFILEKRKVHSKTIQKNNENGILNVLDNDNKVEDVE